MRTRAKASRLPVAVALAAVLALSGCGLLDEQAETTTDVSEEEADRLAQLEAELRELREDRDSDDGEDNPTPAGTAEDLGPDDTDEEPQGEGPATDVVDARVFEVNETQTNDVGDLEVTVERIIVHDYHVEVELTAVNDHPEDDRNLWSDHNYRSPQLFDEQDRRFSYQHPGGYNSTQYVQLEPGQRVDAVVMFGRRLHPDAQVLTLRFRHAELDGWEWVVDLEEAER